MFGKAAAAQYDMLERGKIMKIHDPRKKITILMDENFEDIESSEEINFDDLDGFFSAEEQEELLEMMDLLDADCRLLFDPS